MLKACPVMQAKSLRNSVKSTKLLVLYLNPLTPPKIKLTTNKIRKMQKMILAISAEPAAIPPNPNIAATKATTKKITTHLNITLNFRLNFIIQCVLKIPYHNEKFFRNYYEN